MTPAIELDRLGKSYGATVALDEVTLTIARGEVFGYVGPNGAGKTTTLRILAGLVAPDRGDARVLGASIREKPLDVKATIGFVPESGAIYERLTPLEYLSLIGRLHGLSKDEAVPRIDRWLRDFGLLAKRDETMTGLSLGMRQKICWIAALLHEPEVLVLDEPLNGLDVEAVAFVKDLMARLASEGRTVFYSSHLIDIVAKVCTRIAILNAGRILATGTVDEILSGYGATSLEKLLLEVGGGRA